MPFKFRTRGIIKYFPIHLYFWFTIDNSVPEQIKYDKQFKIQQKNEDNCDEQ